MRSINGCWSREIKTDAGDYCGEGLKVFDTDLTSLLLDLAILAGY